MTKTCKCGAEMWEQRFNGPFLPKYTYRRRIEDEWVEVEQESAQPAVFQCHGLLIGQETKPKSRVLNILVDSSCPELPEKKLNVHIIEEPVQSPYHDEPKPEPKDVAQLAIKAARTEQARDCPKTARANILSALTDLSERVQELEVATAREEGK